MVEGVFTPEEMVCVENAFGNREVTLEAFLDALDQASEREMAIEDILALARSRRALPA